MVQENFFKYGEFEGVLDNSDYEQMEAWENGFQQFTQTLEDIESMEKQSDLWRAIVLCITDEIIDPLFGEGSANEMFGNRITSGMTVLDAFICLAEKAVEQNFETVERLDDMKKRITNATGNRQTRRVPVKRS